MSSRSVNFKTLWLLSRRDVKGRRQEFSRRTILFGGNGTGKSRIIKNLFWALGCEPLRHVVGSWDPDTIAALDFEFNGRNYTTLRTDVRLALFLEGELLFHTKKKSEWDVRMASLFGYHLKLQRPSSTRFDQAGLDYLTLPFYMDQDGSWGPDWHTYHRLGQFTKWKKPTFEAFIGLRLNAYFEAKQERDLIRNSIGEKRNDLGAQTAAFDRVQEFLPKDAPTLDPNTFREELAQLAEKATEAYQRQSAMRGKLFATVRTREQVKTDWRLAAEAQRELVSDIVYLTDLPSGPVECPTCGTEHENSFHARLQLSQDTETMAGLVSELKSRIDVLDSREAEIRSQLAEVDTLLSTIESTSSQRKADLQLSDILAAHSKQALDAAFASVSDGILEQIHELTGREEVLAARIRMFEDRRRHKQVSEFYRTALSTYSSELNVPRDEQVDRAVPGGRSQAGGSSSPRSILAVHLALIATNVEHGDSPLFPFVVDTPQQSGQDGDNLRRMIEVLSRSASAEHQVILAVEALPKGLDVDDFDVVTLSTSHGALTQGGYAQAVERIRPLYQALEAAKAS